MFNTEKVKMIKEMFNNNNNLNNFGRGPLDDAIYQTYKLWAL